LDSKEDVLIQNKKPSGSLVSMMEAAAQCLLDFGNVWGKIKTQGRNEGFTEKELQDMLRPYLKEKLDSKKVWYLFHKEEQNKRTSENYQSRTINSTNAGNNVLLNDEKTFQKRRLEALARDNNKCTMCGTTEDLQIHHIKHNAGIGIDHSLDNLQTLCRICHSKITRSNSADSPNRPHVIKDEEPTPEELAEINKTNFPEPGDNQVIMNKEFDTEQAFKSLPDDDGMTCWKHESISGTALKNRISSWQGNSNKQFRVWLQEVKK
jgi:5-methylcytosine-specific restriction protein A